MLSLVSWVVFGWVGSFVVLYIISWMRAKHMNETMDRNITVSDLALILCIGITGPVAVGVLCVGVVIMFIVRHWDTTVFVVPHLPDIFLPTQKDK